MGEKHAVSSPQDRAITEADGSPDEGPVSESDARRTEAHRRRRVRYFEQVSAAARLQAVGVSMRTLLEIKAMVDSGRLTDWPEE
jgi:hypothetical protein